MEAYSIIKTDNPDFTLGQIASETSKRWRALTDEQEKPYYDLAAEELILYPHVKSVEQLEAKEQRKQARLANPKKHCWWLRSKSSIRKGHRFRLTMSRNNTIGYRGIEATLLFYFVVYFI